MPDFFLRLDKEVIVIDCWLEGPLSAAPIAMLLDTASSLTCVPLDILAKIGVDLNRPIGIEKIITVTGPVEARVFRVPVMRMFDFTLGEVPVIGLGTNSLQNANIRLLGLNILRMFNISLNFDNNIIRLEPRKRVAGGS